MIPTLMVIDDNAIDQKLYTRIITRSGLVGQLYSFVMAQDALDFLTDPASPAVDVILLDINMPCMNGFEFLDAAIEKFGEKFVKAAVIMLTTSMSHHDQKRAAGYAVVKDYINKPLTTDHLLRVGALINQPVA